MISERDYLNANSAAQHIFAGSLQQPLTAVPAQPLTSEIHQRIEVLFSSLSETNGALCDVGDRLLGSIPRGALAGNAVAEKPSGAGAEILGRLDRLIDLANQAQGEAHRINRGL